MVDEYDYRGLGVAVSADVRKRPGMFVGDTDDGSGVLNLLLDVLANAFDQHLAGRCSRASVHIAADGTITVEDDGPGLAAGGGAGLPPLHVMLTQRSTRATVDGHRPHAHLGIGGLGLFVVNALSERLELRTVREGALTTRLVSSRQSRSCSRMWPTASPAKIGSFRRRPSSL